MLSRRRRATAWLAAALMACPLAPTAPAAASPTGVTVQSTTPMMPSASRLVAAFQRYQKAIKKQRKRAARAMKFAKRQLGKPYRYGATGPNAFDCSGLTQSAWRKAGVNIPRVSYSQFSHIKRKVRWRRNLQKGDLLFFRGKGHVGLYLRKGKYLHSPKTGDHVRVASVRDRRGDYAGAVRPGAPALRRWPAAVRMAAQ